METPYDKSRQFSKKDKPSNNFLFEKELICAKKL